MPEGEPPRRTVGLRPGRKPTARRRDHGRWWGFIGLLPLLTAAVRFCPAYLPLGLSTCPRGTGKPVLPPEGPKPA